MLIWVDKIPIFNKIEGVILIEKCISCNSSTKNMKLNEIIINFQTHKFKATCFIKSREKFRFNYPMNESEETRILKEDEIHINNKGEG